ncbi:hypothetical protein HLRTI_002927 [Halorhabdus tiamatea SARL4B]|uniref:Uncharacterized protein n=1 Tax=Halorhabdus tiamatea SARL4B TaxID=1033806 RepID=U2DY79_9EURY|nr:hypothetical protein [Halorhabdus tiamatea]ERJ05128.1 hypothetical protein HLRTI_002927 [Halorhabdus tiamatea SARL4B]
MEANTHEETGTGKEPPKLSSPNSPLRKLSYDSGFFIRLSHFAEQAGLERGDRVIPELTEEGSIVLLEDTSREASDSRSVKGHSNRVNVPPTLIRGLGIDQEEYDQQEDPIVCFIEPYPNEEGYPSAVEVVPLGFASEVLDSNDRLLTATSRSPEEDTEVTKGKTVGQNTTKTERGRTITQLGIAPNIIDIAAGHYPVDDDDLWMALEDITGLNEDYLNGGGDPIKDDHRLIYPASENTWERIKDELDLGEDLLESVKFIHGREADLSLAKSTEVEDNVGVSNVECIVVPRAKRNGKSSDVTSGQSGKSTSSVVSI